MCAAVLFAAACLVGVPPGAPRAKPETTAVMLRSGQLSVGLPLGESKGPVYAVSLDAEVDAKGEGRGTLVLDPNPPAYDEYGDPVTGREVDRVETRQIPARPAISLECTIKFVKAGAIRRVNDAPTRRSIFSLKGPKITSALAVATEGPGLAGGRLLVLDKDRKVEFVVELYELKPVANPGLPVPCHPGCFPAGTPVRTPDGTTPIERVRVGDTVTTVGPDGRAGRGTVVGLFTTTNRLVAVRTDGGTAVVTAAQPFRLAAGGFRKAGDLTAGDAVWRWRDGRREKAVVREVVPTGREAKVFNLVVGDSAVFIAADFLVRGKPPADPTTPAPTGGAGAGGR